jgi:hypothetical protein
MKKVTSSHVPVVSVLSRESTMQERVSNMIASSRIEGLELDEATRADLDALLSGQVTHADLLKRVLAEYQRL